MRSKDETEALDSAIAKFTAESGGANGHDKEAALV